jgi:short-subunit dehydrogenase
MKTKTILITGAGTGIGRDSAIYLISKGHNVIATTQFAEQVSNLKNELGPTARVFKLDITVKEDREKILEYNIDVLINNAAEGQSGSVAEVDLNIVRNSFEVNVFSQLELTQLIIPKMIEKGGGTIVFISSVAGRIPLPFMMPYSMTKFALSAAAAALREEMKVLDKGVKVSIVEPGPYRTGFNQRLSESRFKWMKQKSLFSKQQIEKLKADTNKQFEFIELKSTKTIVNKIVKASESDNPSLRYVAPWWIALSVRLARIFGV